MLSKGAVSGAPLKPQPEPSPEAELEHGNPSANRSAELIYSFESGPRMCDRSAHGSWRGSTSAPGLQLRRTDAGLLKRTNKPGDFAQSRSVQQRSSANSGRHLLGGGGGGGIRPKGRIEVHKFNRSGTAAAGFGCCPNGLFCRSKM